MATIIASQAVISGAFSITRQAIQLGYLPRLEVRHTSEREIGQVYVPRINYMLLIAIFVLVLFFRSSDNLGAAYGIAVSGMMAITTMLAFLYMRSQGWSLAVAVPIFAGLRGVDVIFLSANLLKFAKGGWFPVMLPLIVFTIMGDVVARPPHPRRTARPRRDADRAIRRDANPERPVRVPGTAIFMTRDLRGARSRCCTRSSTTNSLHERVILMQVETEDVPHVADERRLDLAEIGKGFHTMRVRYGFIDEPNVMRALAQAACSISASI